MQEAGMREVQEQEELALRVVRDKASSRRLGMHAYAGGTQGVHG